MYHTRPIKTYDMITALIDRVSDNLVDVDAQYDDTLSNSSTDSKKLLLTALIQFNESFLENRDG
mgnify:CR=1 FL=1